MSGKNNLIYLYDGSYAGLLCCIYRAFAQKESPMDIWEFDREQPTLYPTQEVPTRQEQAERVQGGIHFKLGDIAERWVWDTWYSALENREMVILDFLRYGFKIGPAVVGVTGHPQVAPIFAASRALRNEAHLLTGFLRFTQIGGVLVSTIQPKNFVLPFLEAHFSTRFPREQYLIFDKTHRCALFVAHGDKRIVNMDTLELPTPTAQEQNWQRLWQQFYDTIEIQQRHNSRCRMTNIPKRYWSCTQELAGETAIFACGKLPVSVQQALQFGELQLPNGMPYTEKPVFLTPTQASGTHRLPTDTSNISAEDF